MLKICWNFFATSNGKGPVDGIGGTIKKMAMQKVIQRKLYITNAASFYDAVNGESNVKVFLVEAEEIENAIETSCQFHSTCPPRNFQRISFGT